MFNGRASTNGGGNEQMRAASVRAFDAYAGVQRRANTILEELDEVTEPHGTPTMELDDEDSAVHVLEEAGAVHATVAADLKAG